MPSGLTLIPGQWALRAQPAASPAPRSRARSRGPDCQGACAPPSAPIHRPPCPSTARRRGRLTATYCPSSTRPLGGRGDGPRPCSGRHVHVCPPRPPHALGLDQQRPLARIGQSPPRTARRAHRREEDDADPAIAIEGGHKHSRSPRQAHQLGVGQRRAVEKRPGPGGDARSPRGGAIDGPRGSRNYPAVSAARCAPQVQDAPPRRR